MSEIIFPVFGNWEPTRQTLHWYSQGAAAVPRAHARPHPKWRHVSYTVSNDGLVSKRSPLPDGRELWFKIDLVNHQAVLFVDEDVYGAISFLNRLSSSDFAGKILAAAADLGLEGTYERERFEDESPREYNPEEVKKFVKALTNADRLFQAHRASLPGETSPVQLWPHNFDLAVEWFGTRVETYDGVENQSQLNLGFYPGDAANKPYFYSNPWPFEGEMLLDKTLPEGASWHTEGWLGTILPYEELAGKENAEERLLDYARSVFNITSPTLTAE